MEQCISVIVDEAGGIDENTEKILSGGPMMGQAMFNLDVPVIKGSSALLAFKHDQVAHGTMTQLFKLWQVRSGLS